MMNREIRRPAQDHALRAYKDAVVWLPELIRSSMQAGEAVIRDRAFTNCTLEGPAVILALGGVRFDACNMGQTGGDIRNLVLRPAGPQKVVGAIPFQNCSFTDCDFFAVGFTGPESFLQSILSITSDGRT